MSMNSLKEAPIYFSNIFISFLGLAYYTPLGCSLRFNFFGSFVGNDSPIVLKLNSIALKLNSIELKLNWIKLE